MNLGELFDKYGSDKARGGDCHLYHEFYDSAVPRNTRCLVEVGLGSHVQFNGSWGSARAWLDWLDTGFFCGFDCVEPPADLLARANFLFMQGDQSVREDLERFAAAIKVADVIIDDGSHVESHQLLTLDVLWPCLKPGGFYVVEDLYKDGSARSLLDSEFLHSVIGRGTAAVLQKPS